MEEEKALEARSSSVPDVERKASVASTAASTLEKADRPSTAPTPDPEKASYPWAAPSPSHGSQISHSAHDHDDTAALTPQISRHDSHPPLSRQATSIRTNATSDPRYEIDWGNDDDHENPLNWPLWYKGLIIFSVSFGTVVIVLYSTSYTSGIFQMEDEFNIHSEPIITLGVTVYLIGLAIGSLILAPLSEIYGRKPTYVVGLFVFVLFIIPCGVSKSLEEVLVARFIGAIFGSAMIANAPGTINDIVSEEYRALAFSIWSLGPMNSPVLGPILGGFSTEYLGFRWANWIVLILGCVSFVTICLIKETYAPVLLSRRAAHRRKETNDSRWWCRYEQRDSLWTLLRINLTRPFVMSLTEPICIFWNVYIAIIYGIMYMCFVAFPIVFTGIRGWTIGMSGLSFTGLGVGSTLVIILEPACRRIINSHRKDPDTGRPSPEASVAIFCIAAFLAPIGQLWFAWTCTPPVHWIWPILAGIPFGMGNSAVFIYSSSYLAGAYGIYTASAMAGNAVVRSMVGGTLPLLGPIMYQNLGPHWAGTLLGFLQILIIPIPFAFYKWGGKIRERSALIRRMRADKQRLDRKTLKRVDAAEQVVLEAGIAGVPNRELDLDVVAKALENKETAA